MIEQHLQSLREGGQYSQATVNSAVSWLEKFAIFCGDRCPLELRESDLVAWHKKLSWTPGPSGKLYSAASINQAVGAVRRFYRWSKAEGLLTNDPTKQLVTPHAERSTTPRFSYSASQRRKLLNSPDLSTPIGIRNRAILALLLETRISNGACSRIDRTHLQFDTGALLTTGRSRRIHSLSEGLLADIDRYLRESRPLLVRHIDPALFLTQTGKRVRTGNIARVLRIHRELAGFFS